MSQARLAKEVCEYERYAGHRLWEGARGTISGTYSIWQRHRYTRSTTFPRLHVVLAGKAEHLLDNRRQALTAAVHGITIAVWVNILPRLQRGEPWYDTHADGGARSGGCEIGGHRDTPCLTARAPRRGRSHRGPRLSTRGPGAIGGGAGTGAHGGLGASPRWRAAGRGRCVGGRGVRGPGTARLSANRPYGWGSGGSPHLLCSHRRL